MASVLRQRKAPAGVVVEGDCVEILADFPEKSIDLVFADPP